MSRPLPGDPPPWIPKHELEIVQRMHEATEKLSSNNQKIKDYDYYVNDNRSVSFRNHPDQILIVQSNAHEIRPPQDTGVRYTLPTPDEPALVIRLEDPPNPHLYKHRDLQVNSEHELCQACRDVLNYFCFWLKTKADSKLNAFKSKRTLPNLVVHHFNIASLIAWSASGCYLCPIIMKHLRSRYPAAIRDHTNLETYRVEVCWPSHTSADAQRQLAFVLTNPTKPKGQWNFNHFFHMELWPTQSFGHYFELPTQLSRYGISSPIHRHRRNNSSQPKDKGSNTGGPLCQDLIKSWLNDCLANSGGQHTVCNRSQPDFMPTRLLDIQSAESTKYLRMVSFGNEPEAFVNDRRWVTVSHCWGAWGAQKNPITKNENLSERERVGIPVSELPQTFRHAIEISKWLNVRWLWIDCLCIVQDSKEDWLREASLMDRVYQHGLLNISANAAEDSSVGCFADRDPLNVSAIQFSAPALKQSWKLTPDHYGTFDWMDEVPSLSRVWIHRERQLSRRILHFNSAELVWECCGTEGSAFASETFPSGAPFKCLFNNYDAKYQSGRLQEGLKANDPETYAVWNDICEGFSGKGLTQPTDMPIVFSSLAKEFAELLPGDEYLAGMWRATLPQSLAWRARRNKRKGMTEPIAPSWSWMSTGSVVELQTTSRWEQQRPLLEVLDVALDPEYDDTFGPLQYGSLFVRGFLRQVRIVLWENYSFDISVLEDDGYQTLGPAWDDYHGDLCEVRFDESVSSTRILDAFCLFVTVVDQETSCLLLVPAEGDTNKFRRVGWLKLYAGYSVKMRYVIDDSHDDWDEESWRSFAKTAQRHEKEEEEQKGGEKMHGLVDDENGDDKHPGQLYQGNAMSEQVEQSDSNSNSNAIHTNASKPKSTSKSNPERDSSELVAASSGVDIMTALYRYDSPLEDKYKHKMWKWKKLEPRRLRLV